MCFWNNHSLLKTVTLIKFFSKLKFIFTIRLSDYCYLSLRNNIWQFFLLYFADFIWGLGDFEKHISCKHTSIQEKKPVHTTAAEKKIPTRHYLMGWHMQLQKIISCTKHAPRKKIIAHERVWKKFVPIPNPPTVLLKWWINDPILKKYRVF